MDENLEGFFTRIRNLSINDIPIRIVPRIQTDVSCQRLFSCFFDVDVPAMIVVDEIGDYFGLLSEQEFLVLLTPRHTDIHDALTKAHIFACSTAEDLAHTQLPKVADDVTIKRVTELFHKYESTTLPRVEKKGGEVKGVINLRDIISFVKQKWREEGLSQTKEKACEG